MQDRIIKVFYGNDCLPYKDSNRSVHYPIMGNSFQGSSNVTELRFYTKDIGGINRQWCVIGKLPNGKKGFKILGSPVYDELENEYYYSFYLTNFFTQYKGNLFLCLGGYTGNLVLQEEYEYELSQTLVETTGAIKIDIAYSTQIEEEDTDIDNWQDYLEALGGKLNTTLGIVVIANNLVSVIGYEEGQMFYSKADNKFYVLDSGSLVLFANPLENEIGVLEINSNTQSTITDTEYLECAKKHCIIIDTYTNETYQKENISGGAIYFQQTYNINSSGTYSVATKKYISVSQTSSGGVHSVTFASKTTNLYDKSQLETYIYNYLQPHIHDYEALNTLVGQIVDLMPNSTLPIGETLATQSFVNSTVENLAATPRGNYDTQLDLLAVAWQDTDDTAPYFVANNDFAYVNEVVAGTIIGEWNSNDHIGEAWKFSYSKPNPNQTGQWLPDIKVNNAPFTQAQIDAINSGITQALVQLIQTNQSDIATLNNKLPKMLNITIQASEWLFNVTTTYTDLNDINQYVGLYVIVSDNYTKVTDSNKNDLGIVVGTTSAYSGYFYYVINGSDYGLVLSANDLKIYAPKQDTDQVLIDTYNIQCSSDDTNNRFMIKSLYDKPDTTFNIKIGVLSGTILEEVGE